MNTDVTGAKLSHLKKHTFLSKTINVIIRFDCCLDPVNDS